MTGGIAIWADGRLRDPSEPVLTALDRGVTVGHGAFETCGVVRGHAFALTRHLARLRRSLHGLGLPDPDEDLLRRGVAEVLVAAPAAGRVRLTVTAGPGALGATPAAATPTTVVTAGPAGASGPVRVVRVPWARNERSAVAGLKTTSYVENVVALARAAEAGADEALLANTVGDLCEGAASNVFVERDGELLTPPLSVGCLPGITRELVLRWSGEEGLPVREAGSGELPFGVLDDVVAGRAGLALTGSVRTVVPVVALDGHAVAAGPVTARVRDLYARRSLVDVDP